MRCIVAFALLLMSCEDPMIVEDPAVATIENDLPEVVDTEAGEAIDEAELARTERTFEWDPARDTLPATQPGETVRVAGMRVRARRAMTAAQLAEVRERGWNLEAHPESIEELRQATIEGLHRISASEVEFVNDDDLIGIWEVTNNIRRESCDNRGFSSDVPVHITQCQTSSGALVTVGPNEAIPDAMETHLSAMRRLSRFVMGVSHSRERVRLRWTAHVTLTCEMPPRWPRDGYDLRREQRRWDHRLRPNCLRHAELAGQLVDGSLVRDITGRARAIAWGGRCGRPGFACDDPGACSRGLAPIHGTETSNRFWCRPGSTGCSPWVEHNGQLYSDEMCARFDITPRRRPSQRRLGRVITLESLEAPEPTEEAAEAPTDPGASTEDSRPLAAL